ncbi:flagellin N-terminal helical domain-containing protein [Paraburkholderia antibiotica]|uniref:Flagellin n=1 Tax=Paraburkholderia antibiotica TaxID=2728839 RepID=A0A7X9X683_9BURK|nr:flagellin [Paraburkholderia antibiotica]NML32103.1 flagellin [Paraburkholderia antibiotica]
MLGINSNINSLVAQQNLTGSGSALSQAITRLSSGKRINSAADDAAGLAISNIMQTQINGLTQGVSNSNDGVSMVQTASSGLSSLTSSLQRIRQLATQASNGSMTDTDRAALQQEVTQQIQEVNRIASQTTYNGMNVLNGSMGAVSFQVGANVGQTISLNLSQGVSAASLGGGAVKAGDTVASLAVSLDSTGAAWNSGTSTGTEVTQLNVLSDGKGGFSYTDQNGNALSFSAVSSPAATTDLLTNTNGVLSINSTGALDATTEMGAIDTDNAANSYTSGTTLGTITGLDIDSTTGANQTGTQASTDITSITVKSDGNQGYTFWDQNGNQITSNTTAGAAILGTNGLGYTAASGGTAATMTPGTAISQTGTNAWSAASTATTQTVDQIDISTVAGANKAIESIDDALDTVNNLQATLGAAQNRFTAIGTTQQAQSTDLSSAQSQIQDADFAQETAALSKAQVLQQAGISVLSQANSQPQQILKLLQ